MWKLTCFIKECGNSYDVFLYVLQLPKPDNLLMFHRHSSVLLPDDRILVVGGGGNCFSFGTHLNHTPLIIDISKCYDTMQ